MFIITKQSKIRVLFCTVLLIVSGALQAMEFVPENLGKIPVDWQIKEILPCGPSNLLIYGMANDGKMCLYKSDFSGNKKRAYDLRGQALENILPFNDSKVVLFCDDATKNLKILDLENGEISKGWATNFFYKLAWYSSLKNGQTVLAYNNPISIFIMDAETGTISPPLNLKGYANYSNFQTTDGVNCIFQLLENMDNNEKKIVRWDIETKSYDERVAPQDLCFFNMCCIDNNHIALVKDYGFVAVYNFKEDKIERTFKAHDKAVLSIVSVGDGHRYVTGGHDGLVKTWDFSSDNPLYVFDGHQHDGPNDNNHRDVILLTVLPDGLIASSSFATIMISSIEKVPSQDDPFSVDMLI